MVVAGGDDALPLVSRRPPLPCTHGECLRARPRPGHAAAAGAAACGNHRRRRNGGRTGRRAPPHHPRSGGLRPRSGRCRQGHQAVGDRGRPPRAARPARAAVELHREAAALPRRRRAYQRQGGRGPAGWRAPGRRPDAAGRAGGVGCRRQGPRVPHPPGRPRDQPHQPAPRPPDPADDAGRQHLRDGRLRCLPVAREKRLRAAPRPGRPSSSSAAASTASRCRTTATRISGRWCPWASSAPSAT